MRFIYLLCLLVWFGAGGCSSKKAPEPIWVVQFLPQADSNRSSAPHARQGVELALVEKENAEATITGRHFAVLHADTRDDVAAVQAETVRLVTVNKAIAFIGDFDAIQTERLIRTTRSYGVPVIVPGELPIPSGSDAVVSLGVPPAVRGRLLARYAAMDLKGQRAAVLTDSRRPTTVAFSDAFLKAWPRDRSGGSEEWTFTTVAERDERANRIVQASPTVVVLACSIGDFRLLQARVAAGLPNVPLIYGGEDGGAAPLTAELETLPDVYFATVFSPEHLSESGRDFARSYEDRFHEPPDLVAAQSYDAARLLFDSLLHAGEASRDPLGRELARLEQFESVTGSVRWKDRQPRRRVFLTALKKNRPNVVSIVEPDEN